MKVSRNHSLEGFSFYLKDEEGEVYTGGNGFGEIAMQIKEYNYNGEPYNQYLGIDMSYNGNNEQLKRRAANVSDDHGSAFPVHFNDNDRDGKLSAGDQFLVYGAGTDGKSDGPASDGWRLDIQFDASGDIIGSAKML